MKIAIYKTMLKSTGRVVYVGQTKRVNGVGTKYFGTGIHKSFNNAKYRREHFVSEIITIAEDQQKANDLERYYIEYYCTLEEYGGFNVSHGGLTPSLPGEKNPMYGKGYKMPWYGKKRLDHSEKMTGENNPMSKRCPYNGIEFGSIAEAWRYAKDYCGYEYGYTKFRKQFKN